MADQPLYGENIRRHFEAIFESSLEWYKHGVTRLAGGGDLDTQRRGLAGISRLHHITYADLTRIMLHFERPVRLTVEHRTSSMLVRWELADHDARQGSDDG